MKPALLAGLVAFCLAASAAAPLAGPVPRPGTQPATDLIDVPVLKHRLGPGRVIEAADLEWLSLAGRRVGRNVITDPEDLIGQEARRGIAPWVPVRAGEVQRPVLVAKGALVTMTLNEPNLTVNALGRAVDAGALGEVIQVMNVQSRKTVAATVIGPGLVEVGFGRVAAAAR